MENVWDMEINSRSVKELGFRNFTLNYSVNASDITTFQTEGVEFEVCDLIDTLGQSEIDQMISVRDWSEKVCIPKIQAIGGFIS